MIGARRDGTMMKKDGGGQWSKGSRIVASVAAGVIAGCIIAFLYPSGFFVPPPSFNHLIAESNSQARGICICGNMGIATSSRDNTIRFWTLDESNKREYIMSKILLGHTSFVGPLAWISPNEEFPEGGIVSGGMDTLVLVWNLANGEKFETLKGQKLQVTGIALDGQDIVSTSVDCILSRWRKGKQVEVWEAHKAPIQAVIKLPSGELVTGSSDMTLKLWKKKSCIHTFLGHTVPSDYGHLAENI